MNKFLQVCLISLFFTQIYCTNTTGIANGIGGTFPNKAYQSYIFTFSLIRPDIVVTYSELNKYSFIIKFKQSNFKDATSSGQGEIAIINNSVIWGGSDSISSNEIKQLASDGASYYPIIAGSVVAIYNLPGLNPNEPKDRIFLGRNEVGLIFCGKITRWDDPRLQALNPNITLPSQNITVIVRGDYSGTTSIWTRTLSSMSPTFESIVGDVSSFPDIPGNFIKLNSSDLISAYIKVFPYYISYISYSYVALSEVPLAYAYLGNKDGYNTSDPVQGVLAAMNQTDLSKNITVKLYDSPGQYSYPACSYSYILLRQITNDKCDERRNFMKYINFVLTSQLSPNLTYLSGMVPLPTSKSNLVLQLLQSVKCGEKGHEKSSIRYITIPQHANNAFIAMVVLASIGIFVALLLYFFDLYKLVIEVNPSELIYVTFFTLGLIVGYVAVFFWAVYPKNSSVCLARMWMLPLGVSMILSALSARIFQIAMIYRYYLKLIKVTRRNLNVWLFSSLFICFFSQVIILIVWSAVDPYSKDIYILDNFDLSTDIRCKSNHLRIWVGLLFAHFGILIIYSMVVIYVTWSINNQIGRNGSRWIVLSVYNILITVLVVAPTASVQTNDENLSLAVGFGLWFLITAAMTTIFIPKIIYYLRDKDETGSEKSERGNEKEVMEVAKGLKKMNKSGNNEKGTELK